MKKLVIGLVLIGGFLLVSNIIFAQDAPSVSTNAQTNSASNSGSAY